MRSLLIALVLAAPVCAVAAAPIPTYTNPMTTAHHAKVQQVFVTFINHTAQERDVRIGENQYHLIVNSQVRVALDVGSLVRVYSTQNSKVNGQEVMLVSSTDDGSAVFLR